MTEQFDEAVFEHIRNSEMYQTVIGALLDMVEDGDECAPDTLAIINSIIPPERKQQGSLVERPQEVPPIRQPEVLKKHIKKSGK